MHLTKTSRSYAVIDDGTYGGLQIPVLGLCGPGLEWLQATLAIKASSLTVVHVEGSGHFIPEERPEEVTRFVLGFLGH
jgi:pimeloyl-ACP methyl ester carboxylesterase